MCFSASASFTAAAFLIPAGIYCAYSVRVLNRNHYMLLALVPFFFGVQQAIEGGVWLTMNAGAEFWIRFFSVGFVFFSHFFWPFWIPLAAYILARNAKRPRRWVEVAFCIVGGVLGLLFFLPMILHPDMVQTKMCANSLQYSGNSILSAIVTTSVAKWIYIVIIIVPLLIARDIAVKILGVLIFISVMATYAFYSYAFNSVWCFFSAVISMYIVYIIRRKTDPHEMPKVVHKVIKRIAPFGKLYQP